MAGTNSLEIEIFNLFQENPSADYVCRELVSKYERNEVLSPLELEGLSHFLILQGQLSLLQKFYTKIVGQNKVSIVPVGYLFMALIENEIPIDKDLLQTIDQIISLQPQDLTALQNPELLLYSAELSEKAHHLQTQFESDRQKAKSQLIEQLRKHRKNNLPDQEDVVLNQLIKHFPHDIDVGILQQEQLEKRADEILKRFSGKSHLSKPTSIDIFKAESPQTIDKLDHLKSDLLKTAHNLKVIAPDQLYNLSILCFQLESYETALEILNLAPETHAGQWLKAEALFESGRHIELLQLIEQLEKSPLQQADDTYGATYLKARAYHELGQKDLAIKLMSSLIQAAPYYRSSEALLLEWTRP